ncbi:hypothetical protein HanRHA438_Chr13g0585051 [Helianthus annuus]|nr:hypothetical protein HanIR_Chr13g0624971 [Helianthus annuus]KAJ0857003.1 hypothetical protein HanRHA438_Chr13g0585051 [Helianthus annuus]
MSHSYTFVLFVQFYIVIFCHHFPFNYYNLYTKLITSNRRNELGVKFQPSIMFFFYVSYV